MSSPRLSTPDAWIGGLPLPNAGAEDSFRIELAVAEDGDHGPLQLPFVSLGDSGHFSRVLLGRLAGPGPQTVSLLALKLQRDGYRALGDTPATLVNNREIEAMWRRERAHLDAMAGRGAPRLLAATTSEPGLPPLAYDRVGRRMFTPVCPVTWQPLQVCRDDALLREVGLPPWSTTTERHLYCPAAPAPRSFYTWSTADGSRARARAPVRRRHELYQDLIAAWALLPPSRKEELARLRPDLGSFLSSADAADVERRVIPLCYYEAQALALELQDLHFDEFCDLAGGASLAQATAAAIRPGTQGRTAAIARIQARLDGERQWLAAPWTRGDRPDEQGAIGPARLRRLAVEAAFLKLQAFVQVCSSLRAFHGRFRRPHLGLSSDNLMLTLAAGEAAAAPARWCFEAALADVGTGHRLEPSGLAREGSIPPLYVPSVGAVQLYQSPLAKDRAASRELTLQVTGRPMLEANAPAGLLLELRSPMERLDDSRPGDVVRVQPDASLPATGEAPLLGTLTSVSRDSATAEVRLEPQQAGRLAEGELAFTATVRLHPRLRTPCDLFPLGMLLSRALLANDARDLFGVREVWDRILDKLEMSLSQMRTSDPRRIEGLLRSLLDGESAHLGSESVLWNDAARSQVRQPVPDAIWRDLLLMIGRLLTHQPGFSHAAHHGDADDSDPEALLGKVLAEAENLLVRLQTELCDTEARDQELAGIAVELIQEFGAAMVQPRGKP